MVPQLRYDELVDGITDGLRNRDRHARAIKCNRRDRIGDQEFQISERLSAAL